MLKRKITLNIVSGTLLILCGVMEAFNTVIEEFIGIEFRGHYSIMVIGLVHILYATTDILEGVTTIKEEPTEN